EHRVTHVVSVGAGLVRLMSVNDDRDSARSGVREGRRISHRAAPRLVIEFEQVAGQPLPLLLEVDVSFSEHVLCVLVVSYPVGNDQAFAIENMYVACRDDDVSLFITALFLGVDFDVALARAAVRLSDDRQFGRRDVVADRLPLFLRRADGIIDFLFDTPLLLRLYALDGDHNKKEDWQDGGQKNLR